MTRKEETQQAKNSFADRALGDIMSTANRRICELSFEAGAEWADKTMLEKACEWLKNFDAYRLCLEGQKDYFVECFCKAMLKE